MRVAGAGADREEEGGNALEEHLFKHGHGGHDHRLTAGGECVEGHVGGDEGGPSWHRGSAGRSPGGAVANLL